MKDYLNDHEKEQIEAFYKNDAMREAVKKVILAGAYYSGTLKAGMKADPNKNFALALAAHRGTSDKQLANDLRAVVEAIGIVESGFKELSKFEKLVVVKEKKDNPAI